MATTNDGGSSTHRRHLTFNPDEGEQHSVNVAQHYISTTEDRLRLVLQKVVETATANRDTAAPFSTFVSLVLAIATSNFKSVIWFDVFLCLSAATFVWLMFSLVRSGSQEKFGVDEAITKLKGEQQDDVRPFTSPKETSWDK